MNDFKLNTERKISGILFSDLNFLEIDFEKKFEDGILKCDICGEDLKTVGISSVKYDQVIKWCCTKSGCMEEF